MMLQLLAAQAEGLEDGVILEYRMQPERGSLPFPVDPERVADRLSELLGTLHAKCIGARPETPSKEAARLVRFYVPAVGQPG